MARNMEVLIMADCTKSMQDLLNGRYVRFTRLNKRLMSYEGMVRKLLVEKQKKVQVRLERISYSGRFLWMVQKKEYLYFTCGKKGLGKSRFLATLLQETSTQWKEIQRESKVKNLWDANYWLQCLRKHRKESKRNELLRFLMGRFYAKSKGRFEEVRERECIEKWEKLYAEWEQCQKTSLKNMLEMLCGHSEGETGISEARIQISAAIKSNVETSSWKGLKRKSLCRSRKKESRTELQIRLPKRLFDPQTETHGNMGRHRDDTISTKGMIYRKVDVRKERIHDILNPLLLSHHTTRPSVFFPKLQTIGINGQTLIMLAA